MNYQRHKSEESVEDYLETILILSRHKAQVRSIDVANELGYSKPSVSRAMSILKKQDYITMDKSGFIELTEKGREKAAAIYERHKLLTSFLQKVAGVPEEVAEDDACRMEHIISDEVFQGIKRFMNES